MAAHGPGDDGRHVQQNDQCLSPDVHTFPLEGSLCAWTLVSLRTWISMSRWTKSWQLSLQDEELMKRVHQSSGPTLKTPEIHTWGTPGYYLVKVLPSEHGMRRPV